MDRGFEQGWWSGVPFGKIKYQQIAGMPDNEAFEKTAPETEPPPPIKENGVTSPEKPPLVEPPLPADAAKPSTSCCFGEAGLLYAASSALFLSLCSALVKLLDRFEPAELAAFRFVGILVPSLVAALRSGHHLFPAGRRRLLILRALLGTTSLVCKFYALRSMSLADASVILLSVPVFVSVFARIFLKEPCGWLHVVTVAVTLAGMLLITRPPALFGSVAPATGTELLGSALAFTSTLFGANVYVTMRMLQGVPATVIMTVFAAVAAPLSLAVCLAAGGELRLPISVAEGALIAALAACSFLGQLCLTRACHAEQASLVAVVRTVTEVMFAVGWQYVLFAEVPGLLTAAGMALITMSVVLVGLKKWVAALPGDSSVRQRMSCLV